MNRDEILMKEFIDKSKVYGFEVSNYDSLKAIKRKIKLLIPLILEYIYLFEKSGYIAATIRLVSVKGFDEATRELLNMYYDKKFIGNKWTIGDTLYAIQDKRFEDEYIEIVRNKDNGDSRQMIVILLGRLRCEKAIPILIDLLNDDDVDGHAIMALGYFKGKVELLQNIEPFLNHEKIWIRKQAEKAIKKINGK